jgi:hypothetical protein
MMGIKALIWEREESDWWVAQPSGMGFGYEVRITDAGRVRVRRGTDGWSYFEGTDIEAKAAFQADFENLILSFVDPSYASSQAEIERLRTALTDLLAANDAVQMVLCDGPEVPGFDPMALGNAQRNVTAAEDRARAALGAKP